MENLTIPPNFDFHHIGYAANSITSDRELFLNLGYSQEGDSFEDHNQGIRGCFLTGPGPRIEILENLSGCTTLTPWLNAGIRFYHFAYLCHYVDEAMDWACGHRGRVIVAPIPAVAFSGRRIAFAIFRNNLMIEFIERYSEEK